MALTKLQKKLRKQYADEMRKAKNTKKQREIMIKYRKLQFEAEAKKQGMSVAELKKKKSDTFKNMALGMLPFGLGPLGTGLKVGAKLISGALKGAKATKKVTKGAKVTKTGPKLKPRNKQQAAIKKKLDKKKAVAQKKVDAKKATTKKKVDTKKKVTKTGSNIPKVLTGVAALTTTGALMTKGSGQKKAGAMPLPKKRPTKKKDFGMGRVDDFGKGRRKGDMEGGTAPIKPKAKAKPKSTPKIKEMPKKKSKNITAGGNVGFGPKGNIFPSNAADRKRLMDKYGGTGSAAAKAAAQGKQGNLKRVRS